MTVREVFEYILIELNKVEAPSILLEDFNYFLKKGIQQYINKVYGICDLDQQRSDDLMALKVTKAITPDTNSTNKVHNSNYTVTMPKDYLHILSCIVEYTLLKPFKCYGKDSTIQFKAKRLTSDMYSGIMDNYYMKPIYKRPYFYLRTDTDNVKLDISYGSESAFKLTTVYVDYLKCPKEINLTEEQCEDIDTSQVMEFPDYVCLEIINEVLKLIMENAMDPRLQSNIPINQTITPPLQMMGGKR